MIRRTMGWPVALRHPRESGDAIPHGRCETHRRAGSQRRSWIPAFAGMTVTDLASRSWRFTRSDYFLGAIFAAVGSFDGAPAAAVGLPAVSAPGAALPLPSLAETGAAGAAVLPVAGGGGSGRFEPWLFR